MSTVDIIYLQKKDYSINTILHETHINIPLTKTTAAQSEVALGYHRVRGPYFLAVVFMRRIDFTSIGSRAIFSAKVR